MENDKRNKKTHNFLYVQYVHMHACMEKNMRNDKTKMIHEIKECIISGMYVRVHHKYISIIFLV